MKKNPSASEMGKKGAKKWMEKYGSEKYAEMGKLSAKAKLAKDPDYFKKIRAIGVEKQRKLKNQEKNPANQFAKLITGED